MAATIDDGPAFFFHSSHLSCSPTNQSRTVTWQFDSPGSNHAIVVSWIAAVPSRQQPKASAIVKLKKFFAETEMTGLDADSVGPKQTTRIHEQGGVEISE